MFKTRLLPATLIACTAGVLAVTLAFLSFYFYWYFTADESARVQEQLALFREIIASDGPMSARDTLVEKGRLLPRTSAHTLAHVFGEALFNAGGLPYLKYCGAGEFLFGCYHQFIGMAAARHGPSVISRLKEICDILEEYRMSCVHGIGHGLLAGSSHESDSLTHALAQCKALFSVENERQICADGVFMEYNLHTSASVDAAMHRAFQLSNAYTPCVDISAEFRDQCIFELPLWWYYSLSAETTTEGTFKEMGELCRDAPPAISRDACFTGVGFPVAIAAQGTQQQLEALCAAASLGETEYSMCLAGARSCFYTDPVHAIWSGSVL